MKRIALYLAMAIFTLSLNAQEELPTAKGNKLLNVGTGTFGGSGGLNFIPIHIGMDFFIVNILSAGFDLNWRYYASQGVVGKPNLFTAQVVVDYHFNELMNLSPSWDFYTGLKLGAGYMLTDEELEDYNTHYKSGVKFVFDARAGIRYYINNGLALNSEVGVASVSGTKTTGASFTIGITAKLK